MAHLASIPEVVTLETSEIALAREVQAAFLPKICSGCRGTRIASRRLTSNDIGGDFHDFIVDTDGRYSLVIGDVAGHETYSALVMALVLGAVRVLGSHAQSPPSVLREINRLLCRVNDELQTTVMTCSLFYGVVDPRARTLQFCNAGHPCPLVWTESGQVLKLKGTCRLLGALSDLACEPMSLRLDHVKRVFLYTDGITEARSQTGEFFGLERLQQVFERTSGFPIDAQVEAILRTVHDHAGPESPLNDDITAIVADFASTTKSQRTHTLATSPIHLASYEQATRADGRPHQRSHRQPVWRQPPAVRNARALASRSARASLTGGQSMIQEIAAHRLGRVPGG